MNRRKYPALLWWLILLNLILWLGVLPARLLGAL